MSSSPFGGSYADAYDALYETKDYTAECNFIEAGVRDFGSGTHRRLLDLGCGTGGHALELANRGYDVTGVDRSTAMLEIAQRKLGQRSGRGAVSFVAGDIETVSAGSEFDVAVMMFAVMGYIAETDKLVRALRNVRRHLRRGGTFIADFWYGPAVLRTPPGDRVREINLPERTIVRVTHATLDTLSQIVTVDFSLLEIESGRPLRKAHERHPMRYFFAQELHLLLELGGFTMRSLCAFAALNQKVDETTWNAAMIAEAV